MVQERLKKKTPLTKNILGFLLLNALPIAGFGFLAWKVSRGEASLDDLPAGVGRNGVYFAVVVAALIVLVSGILPLVHGPARALRRSLRSSAEIRSECGFGRLVLELLLWPFRQLFYVVFWILRAVCFLASFALIAAAILCVVRLFRPELGDTWFPQPLDAYADLAQDWLREQGQRFAERAR